MSKVLNINGNAINYEAAVQLMDDELREKIHADGIDDPQEFIERYVEMHAEKFDGEEFAPYYGGAW